MKSLIKKTKQQKVQEKIQRIKVLESIIEKLESLGHRRDNIHMISRDYAPFDLKSEQTTTSFRKAENEAHALLKRKGLKCKMYDDAPTVIKEGHSLCVYYKNRYAAILIDEHKSFVRDGITCKVMKDVSFLGRSQTSTAIEAFA